MPRPVILCVDDERMVLDGLRLQLKKNFGTQVDIETETNPEAALCLLEQCLEDGADVPVVIADYYMPGVKGDEFLRRVNAICSASYKIMLTGQATLEGVKNAVNKANLFKYLGKPWEEADLKMTLEQALDSYYREKKIRELIEKNDKMYKKMKKYYISTIRALSNAVDVRDKYTIGHSRRVTFYTLLIAKDMGISGAELEKIEHMAILHDVGKIGIPDSILLKDDSLSVSEYESMKNHVAIGGEILKDIEINTESRSGADAEVDIDVEGGFGLLPGVLYHHERFDGAGYQNEKAGKEIPLPARIICVADAFDAMTSNRPYRSAMSKESAISELIKNAGTQFDPDIVARFVSIMKDRDIEE